MTARRRDRARRPLTLGARFRLALLGGIAATFGAVGLTVTLGQGGVVDATPGYLAADLVAVAVATLLGLLAAPVWVMRVVAASGWAVAILATVFAVQVPAAATTTDTCGSLVLDGTVVDEGTTRRRPHELELWDGREVPMIVTGDGARGVAEVVLTETTTPVLGTGSDVQVWSGGIGPGTTGAVIRVRADPVVGYRLTVEDQVVPALTIGTSGLTVTATPTEDGAPCSQLVWVRLVTRPVSNTLGLAGLGAMYTGAALLTLLAARRGTYGSPLRPDVRDLAVRPPPSTGGAPHPDPPPPPRAPRSSPTAPARPIPPADGAWWEPGIEYALADAAGRALPPDEPLRVGRDYALTVALGVQADEEEEEEEDDTNQAERRFSLLGTIGGLRVEPSIGALGNRMAFPLRPVAVGTVPVVVDVLDGTGYVRSDRLELPVVPADGPTDGHPGPTASTLAIAPDARDDGQRRPPADAVVLLHGDRDGSVDATVVDRHRRPTHEHDGRSGPHAVVDSAGAARATLTRVMATAGEQSDVDPAATRRALVGLAKVGRGLRATLLGARPDRILQGLRELVHDGSLVEIVDVDSGLGLATVPWQLLYDHHLTTGAADESYSTCDGGHGDGRCPWSSDGLVVCPDGFWGLRADLRPLFVAHGRDEAQRLARPTGGPSRGSAVARAHLDPTLSWTQDRGPTLTAIGVDLLADHAAVLAQLGVDGDDLGLLYLYGHVREDRDTRERGVSIGHAALLPSTLDDADGRWTSAPIVVVNGCGSGADDLASSATLLSSFARRGASAVVGTESPIFDPRSGDVGAELVRLLVVDRQPLAAAVRHLRRSLLRRHGDVVGFAYGAHGETSTVLGGDASDEQVTRG